MKAIAIVSVLAVVGCSKKSGGDADCASQIDKGMETFTAAIKERSPNPEMQAKMMGVVTTLRSTLTKRCVADKWAPEVTACFTTVSSQKDMQACQAKLTDDQRSKLMIEIRQAMVMGGNGSRMPPNMAGHPPSLAPMMQGSDAAGSSALPSGSNATPPPSPASAPASAPGSTSGSAS